MRARAVWGLLTAALSCPPPVAGVEPARQGDCERFVVIAHPAVEAEALDRHELARIFLGEVRRWTDGTRVRAVDLSTRSPTRRHFSTDVLRLSVGEVIRHWRRRLRGDRAPEVAASEADAVERVAASPGAVGYVSLATPLEGVRVLPVRD